MAYNPLKEVTPVSEIKDLPVVVIDRQLADSGSGWHEHYRLIENVLCRDEEVANCAVDYDGERVYVALTGDLYDVEDFEVVDSRLREMIGRVASFDFNHNQPDQSWIDNN